MDVNISNSWMEKSKSHLSCLHPAVLPICDGDLVQHGGRGGAAGQLPGEFTHRSPSLSHTAKLLFSISLIEQNKW